MGSSKQKVSMLIAFVFLILNEVCHKEAYGKPAGETPAHAHPAHHRPQTQQIPSHLPENAGFGTVSIHAGMQAERWNMNQVVPSISVSTTYKQSIPGEPMHYDYARDGNPTRDALEENLAALEKAAYARTFSSGMSATMALVNMLKTGDHVLGSDDIYGGTLRYFNKVAVAQHGLQFSRTDLTNLDAITKALQPNTKMVWVESPTNPTLKVVDIAAVVQTVKAYNPDILVVVDNTFMSPFYQNPLELGADLVHHSVTKYINGHSDALMGAVMTNDAELDKRLHFSQISVGAVPGTSETAKVIRGIKTLRVRMQAHMQNALAIAHWLEKDARVERVLYPELESHPQHAVHKKQTTGMSGIISFYIRGNLQEAKDFLSNLKIFTLAISLGGYESLAESPALMTHASLPVAQREELGITDNLIRLSVGCEDAKDLIADIDQALDAALKHRKHVDEVTEKIGELVSA